MNYLSHFFWFVFLDYVSHIVNNFHLKLALHMSYCQFFVHALTSSKDELLFYFQTKESFSQIFKPFNPKLLTSKQIGTPHVCFSASFLVNLLNYLCWHRYPRACPIFDLTSLNPVPHYRLQIRELLWSLFDDCLHKGQSIHGGSLYNIDYK